MKIFSVLLLIGLTTIAVANSDEKFVADTLMVVCEDTATGKITVSEASYVRIENGKILVYKKTLNSDLVLIGEVKGDCGIEQLTSFTLQN
jgi:hypothetical protein